MKLTKRSDQLRVKFKDNPKAVMSYLEAAFKRAKDENDDGYIYTSINTIFKYGDIIEDNNNE